MLDLATQSDRELLLAALLALLPALTASGPAAVPTETPVCLHIVRVADPSSLRGVGCCSRRDIVAAYAVPPPKRGSA